MQQASSLPESSLPARLNTPVPSVMANRLCGRVCLASTAGAERRRVLASGAAAAAGAQQGRVGSWLHAHGIVLPSRVCWGVRVAVAKGCDEVGLAA